MVSNRQLEANRANARKSSGPKTKKGKARSSRNSTTHGLTASEILIGGENPHEFEQLRRDLVRDFCPQNTIERELVYLLAGYFWRLARVPGLEAALINQQREDWRKARSKEFFENLDQATSDVLDRLTQYVGLAKAVAEQERIKREQDAFDRLPYIEKLAFLKQKEEAAKAGLSENGGNLIDFTKLSRYEVSLLNNVARVLSLLSSLRNSGLLIRVASKQASRRK